MRLKDINTAILYARYLLLIFAVGCFMAPVLSSCTHKDPDAKRPIAYQIYKKNVYLLKIYADSLNNAVDSAQVTALFANYDNAVSKLYSDYPSDIDYEITEGENDTLSILTDRIVKIKKKKLYKFSNQEALTDSVSSSSDTVKSKPLSFNTKNEKQENKP